MKISMLVSSAATTLLMVITMICGFWIKSNNITAPSSSGFHTACGIAAAVCSFITLALLIVMLARTKKRG